ncbi:DUF7344 domain-containing protein [Haladaptatus sp. NG-SE-30]
MTSREYRRRTTVLSDPYYRDILSHFDDAPRSLHVTELADRLVKQDETVIRSDEFEQQRKRERLQLHHNALPRLADHGMIDYDRETKTASSRNDVGAEMDWFDGDMLDEVLAQFDTDRQSSENSIGILEGRQAAIEYGRQLADEAEEELFCMYVSTDLLEEKCLRHAEDAIDRGVEIFLGSQNADVRDLTRRNLPDVTLWEPQRGLLNALPGYPRVGRLILIDRRKVMLAILDEPNSDGSYPKETALIGEGEDNPLVILVRELLGPRLDHLDCQSADFHSELHS